MRIIWGSANAMNCDFASHILTQKQPDLNVTTANTLAQCHAHLREEGDPPAPDDRLALPVSKTPPTVVILDVGLPDMDGVEGFARFLGDRSAAIPVVAMGPASSLAEIRDFLRVGAAGYIAHSMTVDGIIGAINLIAAGEKYVPTHLINQETKFRDMSMLTTRELEVLRGLMNGRSNKEIATQLRLSEVTIKHHLKGLRAKLGARNRTHAVSRAIELGIA